MALRWTAMAQDIQQRSRGIQQRPQDVQKRLRAAGRGARGAIHGPRILSHGLGTFINGSGQPAMHLGHTAIHLGHTASGEQGLTPCPSPPSSRALFEQVLGAPGRRGARGEGMDRDGWKRRGSKVIMVSAIMSTASNQQPSGLWGN